MKSHLKKSLAAATCATVCVSTFVSPASAVEGNVATDIYKGVTRGIVTVGSSHLGSSDLFVLDAPVNVAVSFVESLATVYVAATLVQMWRTNGAYKPRGL